MSGNGTVTKEMSVCIFRCIFSVYFPVCVCVSTYISANSELYSKHCWEKDQRRMLNVKKKRVT